MSEFNFAIKEAGIYDPDLNRQYTNPINCSNYNEIIETLIHESLHYVLNVELATTETQDHWVISKINFIDDWV